MDKNAEVIKTETVFQGRRLAVTRDDVVLPNGHRATLEMARHPGSVAIVPRLGDDRIVLIRQYRYAVEEFIWEIPAGTLEPGEEPEACARRELIEETGYRARDMRLLLDYYPSPGILTERMRIYAASGIEHVGESPEPNECITVADLAVTDVRRMLVDGSIRDGKTHLGLMLALGSGG